MTIDPSRPLRLLLASFKHETNTFSPLPTGIRRFFRNSETPLVGEVLPLMHRRGYLPLLIEATMMHCEGLGNQNVQVRSSPRSRLSCW